MLLGLITDIGVLQGCLVSASNYKSIIFLGGRKTIAGVLALLRALSGALSGIFQVAFQMFPSVSLRFVRDIGVGKSGLVSTGLTSIRHTGTVEMIDLKVVTRFRMILGRTDFELYL